VKDVQEGLAASHITPGQLAIALLLSLIPGGEAADAGAAGADATILGTDATSTAAAAAAEDTGLAAGKEITTYYPVGLDYTTTAVTCLFL
jgi:hypothetical protein